MKIARVRAQAGKYYVLEAHESFNVLLNELKGLGLSISLD